MNIITLENKSVTRTLNLRSKLMDYNQLVKFRLTFLVVFSSVVTYLTASHGGINWFEVAMLSIGGFLVTGAANGINQVIEKDFDKLMLRTANRPVATNRMSVAEASLISLSMGISGVLII